MNRIISCTLHRSRRHPLEICVIHPHTYSGTIYYRGHSPTNRLSCGVVQLGTLVDHRLRKWCLTPRHCQYPLLLYQTLRPCKQKQQNVSPFVYGKIQPWSGVQQVVCVSVSESLGWNDHDWYSCHDPFEINGGEWNRSKELTVQTGLRTEQCHHHWRLLQRLQCLHQ